MNWIKTRFVKLFFKHVGVAVRNANLPVINRFFDLANEMSLTAALDTISKEFNWPIAEGTAMDRLYELCNRHLGEYGEMAAGALKAFQRQFNTEEKRKNK